MFDTLSMVNVKIVDIAPVDPYHKLTVMHLVSRVIGLKYTSSI